MTKRQLGVKINKLMNALILAGREKNRYDSMIWALGLYKERT